MGDAEAKLKSKFAQLKAKREAKQQQQQQSGDGAASSAAHGGQPSGALSGILQQMEGSKAHNDDAKIDEKEPGSVVKASALDRSAIEAFQALRVPAGGEPPAKRAKGPGAAGRLPAVPRKVPTSGMGSRDGEAAAQGSDEHAPAGDSAAGSKGDKVDGFPRRVHEALQRIFTEGSLRRDEVEDKVLTALRSLPESDALRALDQFGNEDMSRIRNKAAYLWGIVRNLREGRSKPHVGGPGGFGSHDEISAPASHLKLLWPEEESIMHELGIHEGRLVEREFSFDSSICHLPPAESLYTDEPYQNNELARVRTELGYAKCEAEGQDPVQWLKMTSQVSLTGRVVPNIRQTSRPELCSTTWVQYYELIAAYQLVPASCRNDEKLRSLHLCEMSGASVAALNHYLKIKHANMMMDWVAHTRLAAPADAEAGRVAQVGAKTEEERFMRETRQHWLFGADPDVHVVDKASIEAIQGKTAQGNFDMVLADSGVMSDAHMHAGLASSAAVASTPRDPAREISEAAAAKVFLSQVLVALSTLAAKGSFVMRMWALWEHQNVGLLFLLNCVFGEVKVCRPSTVQLAGEDTFVVCTGFKGIGQAHLAALRCCALSEGSSSLALLACVPGAKLMEQRR